MGEVAVGRARGVVAGVRRLAGARPADGLAVLARHREMGLALGPPRGHPASRRGSRAGRRLSSPNLHSWRSTASRARPTVARRLSRRAAMAYDLLINNGTVIDGPRAPPRHADVAVMDGKIAEI